MLTPRLSYAKCLNCASRPALYAPYGLELLYEGVLGMNPLVPHRELFERKAASYRARRPSLGIASAA